MGTEPQGELEWLAFQYIADELTADQRQAFEERLATDQTAREAVAAMVGLSQGVVSALHTDSPRNRAPATVEPATSAPQATHRSASRTVRTLAWLGAVAAAVAVALANPSRFWAPPGAQSDREARALAMAWVNAPIPVEGFGQSGGAIDEEGDLEADADSDAEEYEDAASSNPVAGDADEVLVPDWLLAAVSERASPVPGDLDSPGEVTLPDDASPGPEEIE